MFSSHKLLPVCQPVWESEDWKTKKNKKLQIDQQFNEKPKKEQQYPGIFQEGTEQGNFKKMFQFNHSKQMAI